MNAATFASASAVFGSRINAGNHRPFLNNQGQAKIVVNGKVLSTNAPAALRYDEWKDIDREVIENAQQRLVGIADLISGGLVYNLGSVGQSISMYERVSDITPAAISMSGLDKSDEDRPTFDNVSVPVPVIHKDFRVNFRHLEASRTFGAGIDVVTAGQAARVVAEASESMLFSGSAIQVDGSTIYGYVTHPSRNTVTLSEQWTASGKTGAEILADVQAMLTAARADLNFGPFTLYIPGAYETVLDNDFNPGTSDTRTVRQRIMALEGIAQIRVADRIPAHTVVMVQLTKNVVDLAMAQDITTISWQSMGGLQEEFKVMAVWVPRVKSTFDGQSGVVVLAA